eukprot:gene4519-biopygen921
MIPSGMPPRDSVQRPVGGHVCGAAVSAIASRFRHVSTSLRKSFSLREKYLGTHARHGSGRGPHKGPRGGRGVSAVSPWAHWRRTSDDSPPCQRSLHDRALSPSTNTPLAVTPCDCSGWLQSLPLQLFAIVPPIHDTMFTASPPPRSKDSLNSSTPITNAGCKRPPPALAQGRSSIAVDDRPCARGHRGRMGKSEESMRPAGAAVEEDKEIKKCGAVKRFF